jgi:hypothetical protein
MKTEEEIKKEIDELHLRINRRKSEIREAEKENEEDVIRMETLRWSLITTPCEAPATKSLWKDELEEVCKVAKDRLFTNTNTNTFAGDGPIPEPEIKTPPCDESDIHDNYDDENEFIPWKPNPKKKRKHNPSEEADDFDTESEINQFI